MMLACQSSSTPTIAAGHRTVKPGGIDVDKSTTGRMLGFGVVPAFVVWWLLIILELCSIVFHSKTRQKQSVELSRSCSRSLALFLGSLATQICGQHGKRSWLGGRVDAEISRTRRF